MTVLIIEDEIPAQQQLLRLLSKHFPDLRVVGLLDSITGAEAWLKVNSADIIFMDVELSDGECFEIFKRVEVTSQVIITTAYEDYAFPAFQAKCIDYLLKPIEDEDFEASVHRCIDFCSHSLQHDTAVEHEKVKTYRQRFTTKVGNNIIVVESISIAYFYSENKTTYLVTNDKKQYLMDLSLDAVEEQVDPHTFFKLSRGCIASLQSIANISKHFNSRLKVTLRPDNIDPILVSRARVPQLMEWLEQ